MRKKISRLKKNISLLKQKLEECRQIVHEEEKKVELISFGQKATPPLATT